MSWTLTASGHVTPGDPAGPPQDSAAADMELYEALKAILADPKYGTAASTFSGSHLQRQPRVRLAARGGRVGHGRGEADRGRAGVRPEAPATQPELGPRARRAGAPPAHRRWHHGGAGAHPGAACQRPEDHSCQAAHRSLVTPDHGTLLLLPVWPAEAASHLPLDMRPVRQHRPALRGMLRLLADGCPRRTGPRAVSHL